MAGTPPDAEPRRDQQQRSSAPSIGARRTFKAERATKEQRKLRLSLVAYEGQGKTVTALRLAKRIAEKVGGRILLADTEGESSRIYADQFDFDMVALNDHAPEAYVDLIRWADEQKYAVLIIDSLSHEYIGHGGIQEVVDAEKRKGGFGWDVATVKHRAVMTTIVGSRLHVIATMRQKKAWVKEIASNGKERLRQQGTEPVQREGTEYEFDLIGTIEDAVLTVVKARDITGTIKAGQQFDRPGDELADLLLKIVSAGAPRPEPALADALGIPETPAAPPETPPGDPLTERDITVIKSLLEVVEPAKAKEARAELARHIAELGYPSWEDFTHRGKAHLATVVQLLQGYDRARANGAKAATAEPATP